MAKFALVVKDGAKVRNLEDLQENFDLEKVLGYFMNGKLAEWLRDRYYDDEADEVEALAKDDKKLNQKLCKILGVPYEDEDVEDPEVIARRNERLNRLKQYTDDADVWEHIDEVAFDQEELADLLDKDTPVIYLCQTSKSPFTIPARVKNKKYIGVNAVEAKAGSKKNVDWESIGVRFENLPTMIVEPKIKQKKENNRREVSDAQKRSTALKTDYNNIENTDTQIGFYLYNDKKYRESFRYFLKAAEDGDTVAMNQLALMYYNGKGVKKDSSKRRYWTQKAQEASKITNKYNSVSVNNNDSKGAYIPEKQSVGDNYHETNDNYWSSWGSRDNDDDDDTKMDIDANYWSSWGSREE